MDKKLLSAVVGTALLAAASNAMAYEAGDMLLRVGAANVNPHASDNLGLDVEDDTQLGLTGVYMLSSNIGLELLAATPFKHDIVAGGTKVGETKQLPPTLSLQFYPMDAGSAFQPYVSAGLNYTTFFSEESILGDTKLDDSWGLAFGIGMDYAINENLLINAAAWKIDIDTEVSVDGTKVGTQKIDPTVVMLSLGYKF
ncbi:Outer membrane protein W precursor [Marinobacterium lacunae]|uniref:Outer membrane protein W n=1 Tax=Marinobacterium lacunae TaxID=1232683 RepID=A0A081G2E6_9GAMM|nr:OmpW family outer membrane protein [Marinobacterium lacunae]KEA64951.1 Outer membrane protein W precursor [Marinobacterium lacunae]MBR9882279.1 outer membrane beta-barrel protein [Oceanospirillales bacterium]